MKLTLPVYCGEYCGEEAYFTILLYGRQDTICVVCPNGEKARQMYCCFGFLDIETEKIKKQLTYQIGECSSIFYEPCIFRKVPMEDIELSLRDAANHVRDIY